jgi:hypothetical protein
MVNVFLTYFINIFNTFNVNVQRRMELLVVFTIVGSVGLLLALAEGSR